MVLAQGAVLAQVRPHYELGDWIDQECWKQPPPPVSGPTVRRTVGTCEEPQLLSSAQVLNVLYYCTSVLC